VHPFLTRPNGARSGAAAASRPAASALGLIGEWRDRSDTSRSPVIFIKGMWAARREASQSLHRIREDIRKLR
jgi:hypothetical protein